MVPHDPHVAEAWQGQRPPSDEYAALRVLFVHHTNPAYMRPIQLSARQIVCGPFCQEATDGDRVLSLQTAQGSYDLADVMSRVPDDQQPDLIVVGTDASRTNFPRGLDAFDCPKVMIAGDTGHMYQPLRTVLNYALSEPFDLYVTPHMPRHSHFFVEMGLTNTYWIPALSIQTFDVPFREERDLPVTFVGQAGRYHPNRVRMLEHLEADGIDVIKGVVPQEEAFRTYGNSMVTLNLSGNGDLNMRVSSSLTRSAGNRAGTCSSATRSTWSCGPA
jgi:hypothetical protein